MGLLAVALAPTILSTRPGRAVALALLEPFLPVEVEVGDLEAGWTKGIEVRDLRIRSRDGREAFTARRAKAAFSLRALLRGRVEGLARLEEPRGTVRRRRDGTVEIAGLRIEPQEGGAHPGPSGEEPRQAEREGGFPRLGSVDLSLTKGSLRLIDETGGPEASLEDLSLSLRSSGRGSPILLEAEARLRTEGRTGTVSLKGKGRPDEEEGEVEIRFDSLDLEPLSPLAAAGGSLSRIAGLLDGTLSASLSRDGTFASAGEVRARDLRFESARPDVGPWVEPSVTIRPALRFDPRAQTLSVEGLEIRTSFASLTGRGKGGGTGLEAGAEGSVDFACDLGAALDRARLFAPGLPSGTGRISGKATASGSGGSLRIDLDGKATGLALSGPSLPPDLVLPESASFRAVLGYDATSGRASLQGGRLEGGPLLATFVASREVGADGPVLAGRARVEGDLAALERHLRPFLPEGLLLSGTLGSEFTFQSDPRGVEFQGEASVADLLARSPGRGEVRSERLEANLEVARAPGEDRLLLRRVRAGTGGLDVEASGEVGTEEGSPLEVHVRGGGDLAEAAALARLFASAPREAKGRLRLELDLTGTRRSARFTLRSGLTGAVFGPVGPPPLEGTLDCEGTIAAGSSTLAFERGRLVAPFCEGSFSGGFSASALEARLRLEGDLARAEPYLRSLLPAGTPLAGRVRLDGYLEGSPERASFGLNLDSSGLAGGPVEADLSGTYVQGEGLPALEANGDFRADLASLLPFARLANPRLDLSGNIRGEVRTRRSGAATRLEAGIAAERFRLASLRGATDGKPSGFLDRLAASPLLEKEARIDLLAILDADADRLAVERADIRAVTAGLEAKARGTIEGVSKSGFLDGTAEFSADGKALRASAAAAFPPELRLSGTTTGRFTLGGRLRPDALHGITVSGTIEIPALDLADNALREGRFEVALSGGTLRIREGRARLNEGEVTASGAIEFPGEGPALLALEGNAKEVKVRRGLVLPLAHLVPIFASARPDLAEVSGAVTADFALRGRGLDDASLRRGLTGNARVRLGAGSISGSPEFVPILAALKGRSSFDFDDVAAAFEVGGARLSTEGIRIGSKEASLTLVGSTGFDGTLDYRIVVDLPERVERRSWGAALERVFGAGGLPVGLAGTVRSPALALRAPDLRDAADGLLQGGLDRLLEGLKKKDEEEKKKKKKPGRG
ncbi:MAG: AsmA-like C-terminal region-containing protein [Planctomycetota bacterium]